MNDEKAQNIDTTSAILVYFRLGQKVKSFNVCIIDTNGDETELFRQNKQIMHDETHTFLLIPYKSIVLALKVLQRINGCSTKRPHLFKSSTIELNLYFH